MFDIQPQRIPRDIPQPARITPPRSLDEPPGLRAARIALSSRDVDVIRDHFTKLVLDSMPDAPQEHLDEINLAAARLAALDDPAAAAFSGWLLLTIAKRMEGTADVTQ